MGEETHFVDIAQNHLFHTLMLKYFAYNAAISTSNYQDIFWIRVAREREMRDHFLVAEDAAYRHQLLSKSNHVRELITLC